VLEGVTDELLGTPKGGISRDLIDRMKNVDLRDCFSISAVDVLGPAGWLSPSVFRYMAPQVKHYVRSNGPDHPAPSESDQTGKYRRTIVVSSSLHSAIQRAGENARRVTVAGKPLLEGSLTIFDDEDIQIREGQPRLQYSRVLIWTHEELVSDIADAVVRIHRTFDIPLFCILVEKDDPRRHFDFIVFERRSGKTDGLTNVRNESGGHFTLHGLDEHGRPPNQSRTATEIFDGYLAESRILFAQDAIYLLRRGARLFGDE
jgi:hypothetical protein